MLDLQDGEIGLVDVFSNALCTLDSSSGTLKCNADSMRISYQTNQNGHSEFDSPSAVGEEGRLTVNPAGAGAVQLQVSSGTYCDDLGSQVQCDSTVASQFDVYCQSSCVLCDVSSDGASLTQSCDGYMNIVHPTAPITENIVLDFEGSFNISAIGERPGYLTSPEAWAVVDVHFPPVADPVFVPFSRHHFSAVAVSISCSTPGAHVVYTTDGTIPDVNSTLYTGAFELQSTTIITTVALMLDHSYTPSAVKTARYQVFNPR